MPDTLPQSLPGLEPEQRSAAPRIAVLVPCYNEEVAIPRVVQAFRAALPEAAIYVYDNNSKDRTVEVARAAGAVVRTESLQGKGHVVRRMFADIEADIYVLVDGDDTYEAAAAPRMVAKLVEERLDMVTGIRVSEIQEAYRPGHRFGNLMLTGMVRTIFGNRITDMLSGYRVFSRRFVKSFPALAAGFETETEFTVHALELMLPVGEIETAYKDRPVGSVSQAAHLLRRLAHPQGDHRPGEAGEAAALLLLRSPRRCCWSALASARRWSGNSWRPAWCRGCRPRCWPWGWCCCPSCPSPAG